MGEGRGGWSRGVEVVLFYMLRQKTEESKKYGTFRLSRGKRLAIDHDVFLRRTRLKIRAKLTHCVLGPIAASLV
jgi:hypothetical protein